MVTLAIRCSDYTIVYQITRKVSLEVSLEVSLAHLSRISGYSSIQFIHSFIYILTIGPDRAIKDDISNKDNIFFLLSLEG